MRDEEGMNIGSIELEIEQPHGSLPLIEEGNICLISTPSHDTLHHTAGSEGEETTFIIVPITLVTL